MTCPSAAFQAEQIVIADASDWVINDLSVGFISQFANKVDIRGDAFSHTPVGTRVRLTPARPHVNVVIVVTYVGDREDGAPFICGVAGNLIRL